MRAPSRHGKSPRRSRKVIIAATAAAVAAVTAIAVVIVTVVLPGKKATATGFVPTGSSPSADAGQIATAFFKAWDAGNLGQAAGYTDHPAAAEAALATYQKYLHLKNLAATFQSAAGKGSGKASAPRESVTYKADATVSATYGTKTLSGTWSYQASLVAYQRPNSPAWYIAWAPDDLAPNLTASTRLAAVAVPPQVVSVTDASGNALSTYGDAGLTNIANLLQQQAPPGQGTPGLDVEIQTAAGKTVANSQAVVTAPSNIPSVSTTISPQAENAARSAVAMKKNSSMAVIQPSTGKILAIANNAGFNDFALTAQVAPGSTMKIITTTALFSEGVLTANSPDQCPKTYTVQGVTYHNDAGESEPPSTPVTTDFAVSCNNAFDRWWPDLTNGRLAAAAKKYYGLDENWNIGIGNLSATYMTVPPSASGSELAEEAFGEGKLLASPLAMASVVATVDSGTFRQPILVPGVKQITATPLSASVDAGLKQEMRAVVTSGTAAGDGLGPNVYAKTGTADIIGQQQPNSWLVAFDPVKDVAVACLVVNSGYGSQFAGPEVASFLSKY